MELNLSSFGLFQKKTFELGQVTLFFGSNESGKTTIFDGIVSSLIRITGTTSYGKKLKERYGENRNAHISKQILEIPASKFLNSYAIREGKVALDEESKETKDLVTSIQKSLFDSGYSLKNLKSICLERSSLKGNVKSGKDFNKAVEVCESKYSLWKKADEERLATLALWSDLPKKEQEKRALADELKQKEVTIQRVTKEITDLSTKQKHSQVVELLQKILLWESKRNQIEEYKKSILADQDKIVLKLDEEIRQLTSQLKTVQGNFLSQSENVTNTQKEIGELSLQREKLNKFEGVLFEIERKLDQVAFENAPKIEKIIWKKGILVLGILFFVLAIGIGLFTYLRSFPSYIYWASGLFGLAGFTLITNFSKIKILTIDEAKQFQLIEKIASELTLRTDGQIKPLIQTREGIRDVISKYKESFALSSQKLDDLNTKLQLLIHQTSKEEIDQIKLKNELDSKEKEFAKILQEFGVRNISEFQEKLTDVKAETLSFQHINEQLMITLSDYHLKDIPSLKLKIKDEIHSFEASSIPSDFSSEEKQKLKNLNIQLELETKEFHRLKEVYYNKETALSGLLGGSQVKIKDILEKCDLFRQELEEADQTKLQLELNMSAYKTLADIFSEMEAGSENQMLGLVQSLSKRWNEILPEEKFRKIEWNQLSEIPKAFDQKDALRSIDQLSTGTKELFYFSLRLEYAFRMSEEDQIKWLLLDEPFRHMDPVRMESAVKYVLEFLSRESWNVIFFTFDQDLKDRIMKNAEEKKLSCILHNLNLK